MWFERNVGVTKPPTTKLGEDPQIALLGTSVVTPGSSNADSAGVLQQLFGSANVQSVATVTGASSLENACQRPAGRCERDLQPRCRLADLGLDRHERRRDRVGQHRHHHHEQRQRPHSRRQCHDRGVSLAGYNGSYPVSAVLSTTQFQYSDPTSGLASSGRGTVTDANMNPTAQSRLQAFFARGGGYVAGNASTNNFSFLSGAALVSGSLTQSSQNAYGGIATWANVGSTGSPISGAYPSQDTMYLPQQTTYFTSLPTGAVVDGQYLPNFATVGPANGYVAGLWDSRTAAANSAPVLVHGTTTVAGRYVAYATNPFSRYDDLRDWPLIVQAALWSDLTDQNTAISYAITASAGAHGSITPNGQVDVAAGNNESYTIKPDLGYMVADVQVDGSSVGRVTSYTFKDVIAPHTISVTFVPFMSAGVLPPLSPTTVSLVSGGSAPIKFQIFDTNGVSMSTLTPVLHLSQLISGVWGPEFDPTSTSAPKSGTTFSYATTTQQYVYNLNTKVLASGTYRLRIDLGFGGEIDAQIQVK